MVEELRQSPGAYKFTLQRILDDRKVIDKKTSMQMQAFECGARALEWANANGAQYMHEAAIMRYQAVQPLAVVMQDDHTRKAIRAAIAAIDRQSRTKEADADA